VASHALGAIELALVFGGVVAWAWWELRVTRRDRRESARREAGARRDDDGNGTRRR
jgi:hypothetical protein